MRASPGLHRGKLCVFESPAIVMIVLRSIHSIRPHERIVQHLTHECLDEIHGGRIDGLYFLESWEGQIGDGTSCKVVKHVVQSKRIGTERSRLKHPSRRALVY